jgi:hypothetical protein
MATTTTNFGFDIPQSTDLVKDGATAIAALGQDIDTAFVDLKGGTTGQVLAKASGTDLDFSWVAVDPLLILDAKGDLITATADNTPARLAVGTNGQVLVADSTETTGLKWATPAGGGKVLQVVQGVTSTRVDNSTTTFADTNMTATITPSAATSKILVFVATSYFKTNGNVDNGMQLRLMRDTTAISTTDSLGYTATTLQNGGSAAMNFLDTPSATSATTYKVEFRNITAAAFVGVNTGNTNGTIILMEIGA